MRSERTTHSRGRYCGWFRSSLACRHGSELSTNCRWWDSEGMLITFSGRCDLNEPPTPVGGIAGFAQNRSVSEFLTNHQSSHSTVHNADPDTAELRPQDVCTMPGRVH